jgi:ABC-type bacteriocin/lantibiotic exporter with double-glycine peptidase domain
VLLALLLALAPTLPVPFAPQFKDTCGAASLAMVLRCWGQDVGQDTIAARLLQPELKGIRGSQLQDFAAERGLTAIAYEGDTAQLRDYLAKGRPLIVAWKVGRGRFHNVVVVGYDEARRQVLVHDPAVGPSRAVAEGAFEKRWAGAGHWTLLVLPKPAA